MSACFDCVVVGAGPAGSAASYWLARSGVDVLMIDKAVFPRDKACGDSLTPRGVRELEMLGVPGLIERCLPIKGLRAHALGSRLDLDWPDTGRGPCVGLTIPRPVFDEHLARHAVRAGATWWQDAEVVSLNAPGGALRSVCVQRGRPRRTTTVSARAFVFAHGAQSRLTRTLGHARRRRAVTGVAMRSYAVGSVSEEARIEGFLGVGHDLPGYGWVFPQPDGTANVGVGVLAGRHRGAPGLRALFEVFVRELAEQRGMGPLLHPPLAGWLPMGLCVSPIHGPNYVLVGDASGAINPFTGEGIAYALETGRKGALCIAQWLDGDVASMQGFEREMRSLKRSFSLAIPFWAIGARPGAMRVMAECGMRMPWLMQQGVVRMSYLRRQGVSPDPAMAWSSAGQPVWSAPPSLPTTKGSSE